MGQKSLELCSCQTTSLPMSCCLHWLSEQRCPCSSKSKTNIGNSNHYQLRAHCLWWTALALIFQKA